jgi:hypothetical protein
MGQASIEIGQEPHAVLGWRARWIGGRCRTDRMCRKICAFRLGFSTRSPTLRGMEVSEESRGKFAGQNTKDLNRKLLDWFGGRWLGCEICGKLAGRNSQWKGNGPNKTTCMQVIGWCHCWSDRYLLYQGKPCCDCSDGVQFVLLNILVWLRRSALDHWQPQTLVLVRSLNPESAKPILVGVSEQPDPLLIRRVKLGAAGSTCPCALRSRHFHLVSVVLESLHDTPNGLFHLGKPDLLLVRHVALGVAGSNCPCALHSRHSSLATVILGSLHVVPVGLLCQALRPIRLYRNSFHKLVRIEDLHILYGSRPEGEATQDQQTKPCTPCFQPAM